MGMLRDEFVRRFRQGWSRFWAPFRWIGRNTRWLWRTAFVRACCRRVRLDMRRYFAPGVGAVMGAVEYTNAAWADVPVGRRRAQAYARLLSALANETQPDPGYIRRLIEVVLKQNGDHLQPVRLARSWPEDLRLFGRLDDARDQAEGPGAAGDQGDSNEH